MMLRQFWLTASPLGQVGYGALIWRACSSPGLPAGLAFSPASKANGTLYISRTLDSGGTLVPGSFEEQAHLARANIAAIAAASGCSPGHRAAVLRAPPRTHRPTDRDPRPGRPSGARRDQATVPSGRPRSAEPRRPGCVGRSGAWSRHAVARRIAWRALGDNSVRVSARITVPHAPARVARSGGPPTPVSETGSRRSSLLSASLAPGRHWDEARHSSADQRPPLAVGRC
jgi:hypothetical protein